MAARGGAPDPEGRRAQLRSDLAALRGRTVRRLATARRSLRPRLPQAGLVAGVAVVGLVLGAGLLRRGRSRRPVGGGLSGAFRGLLWSLLTRTLARAVEEPLRAWVAGLLGGRGGSLRGHGSRDSVPAASGG